MSIQFNEIVEIVKKSLIRKYQEQEAAYQAREAKRKEKEARQNFNNADVAVRANVADALNCSTMRDFSQRKFDSLSLTNEFDETWKIRAIMSTEFSLTSSQRKRLVEELNQIFHNMLTVQIQEFEEVIASDCNEYRNICYQNQFNNVPISKNDSAFYTSYCNFFQAHWRRLLIVNVSDILCDDCKVTFFYNVDWTAYYFYAPCNYWTLMRR